MSSGSELRLPRVEFGFRAAAFPAMNSGSEPPTTL